MSKQYAHLHTMAKTSVKFQNDWPKTEEELRSQDTHCQLLMNGRITARLYRTCVLRRCDNNKKIQTVLCYYFA